MVTNNAINNSTKVTRYDVAGSYSWNKDIRTSSVEVFMWDSGGGGGSGRQGATTASGGGSGGAGGPFTYTSLPASFFNTSETVVVAAGGAGAAAQTSNLTNGITGSPGARSIFGNIKSTVNAASAGTGGIAAGGGGDSRPNHSFTQGVFTGNDNSSGQGGSGNKVNGAQPNPVGKETTLLSESMMAASGGGGGGGADAITIRSGGIGGDSTTFDGLTIINAGGAAGTEAGTIDGGLGNTQLSIGGWITGGTGGGGGGGQSAGAVAGNGGNGGFPGGGGGGGGGSLTGTNSGKGGDGAAGLVLVIEHF